MGLSPSLSDHWQTLYSIGQWPAIIIISFYYYYHYHYINHHHPFIIISIIITYLLLSSLSFSAPFYYYLHQNYIKAMDCGIVVCEFVLQSRYYVHFRANTLGKGINPSYPPSYGLNSTTTVLLGESLWH